MKSRRQLARSFACLQSRVHQLAQSVNRHRFIHQVISSPKVRQAHLWWRHATPFQRYLVLAATTMVVLSVSLFVRESQLYSFNQAQRKLLSKSFVAASKIKQTSDAFSFNLADTKAATDPKTGQALPAEVQHQMELAANKTEASGADPYQAKLPKDLHQGLTFGDSTGANSFRLIPDNVPETGRLRDGHIVYPGGGADKYVFTLKRNGVKEDIILGQAPWSDSVKLSWTIAHGSDLEAKLLPDGSVGLYAANQNLFANATASDAASQALLQKADTQIDPKTGKPLPAEVTKAIVAAANKTESTGK